MSADAESHADAAGAPSARGTVERVEVNPWTWQQPLGFAQGVVLSGLQRLVLLAGQGPVDGDGNVVHEGDTAGQIGAALDNVETVLRASGLSLADVVRLTIYTTDVDRFFTAYGTFAARLAEAGCTPTSSLVGVSRLALPGMEVELEATAVA